MRWILDANSLIYMIKAGLSQKFVELSDFGIVIDKEVYHEVVENGLTRQKPDAPRVDQFLKDNNIPIIPTNIKEELLIFKDAGEASCFVLSKSEGVCITNDARALRKFRSCHIDSMPFDIFFGKRYREGRLSESEFETILDGLVKVNAITQEQKIFSLKKNKELMRVT